MGQKRTVTIHTNYRYKHQRDWAASLAEGCRRHGNPVLITQDQTADGDIHIVLGPHYAMQSWTGKPDVILLDRCYYGDTNQVARLGWLRPNGVQTFATGYSRPVPDIKSWRNGSNKVLVLADFGQDVSSIVAEARGYYSEVRVRLHPSNYQPHESLDDAVSWADVVIGTAGTALIQGILEGVPTTCLDPLHIARPVTSHVIGEVFMPDRTDWLRDLAYAQWSHDEMKSGEAWEQLNDNHTLQRHAAYI